jgi:RNA polymerase sigma-70 factor (ECF subfamily)
VGGRVEASHDEAELAARAAYGRLLAVLASRWRNRSAAEDALGDALLAALETWPRTGVPERPKRGCTRRRATGCWMPRDTRAWKPPRRTRRNPVAVS